MVTGGYKDPKQQPKGTAATSCNTYDNENNDDDNDDDAEYYYDDPNVGLINLRTNRREKNHFDALSTAEGGGNNSIEWQRKYWLGFSLCLILFSFWMLDSLKDPIFGDLVNGNLNHHQPIAKLVSVATTLALVIFLEFLSSARKEWYRRQEQQKQQQQPRLSNESILDGGGSWSRMGFQDEEEEPPQVQNSHAAEGSSFLVYILISYTIVFGLIAHILQHHPRYNNNNNNNKSDEKHDNFHDDDDDHDALTYWHFVGYFLYALIESFGSLAVASFWSFTNTTLSLEDAERYYGPIIAIAQLGAIGGSTMVTTSYPSHTLIYLSCLVILLHLVVMKLYMQRFRPTNIQAIVADDEDIMSQVVEPFASATSPGRRESIQTLISAASANNNTNEELEETSPLWSGVHLILRHNYVLLLLGVSCLYEVSLTCLDYQMKLIGYNRFENSNNNNSNNENDEGITFVDFMGHYGQMVNATSLFLSLIGFPWLIRRFGLRYTLRLFPTLLVLATVVAFGALPGNLAVLFISMSLLKAMTYSIHDPSTELLYLPTSNNIKFKAKFWIDVVGARVAKAIGSTINTYAGSVDRSVSVGSMPSLLTAVLLWVACYHAGADFDRLVESGTIVGLDDTPIRRDSGIHSGIYMTGGDYENNEQDDDDDVLGHEASFVSSPERPAATEAETIELNDMKSALAFNECRRGSV